MRNFVYHWQSFKHNFNWGDYHELLNGQLTRITSLIPLFGYLILFNDFILKQFDFSVISGSVIRTEFLIDTEQKIRLLFFGSICIAFARAIYLIFRPFAVRQGRDEKTYVAFGLENFTAGDFKRLHDRIRTEGHNSLYGKYYDDDWDAYYSDAVWRESGRIEGYDSQKKDQSRSGVHSLEAKRRHDDTLRSILLDHYCGESRKKRNILAIAVFLAFIGYTLILLPTVDLSLRVVEFMIMGE